MGTHKTNLMLREFEEASIVQNARQAVAGTTCNGAVGYATDDALDLGVVLARLLWRWLSPWMMETEPDGEMLAASAQFLAEAVLQPAFAGRVMVERHGAITLPGIVAATQRLFIQGEVEDGCLCVYGAALEGWPGEIAFAGNLYRLRSVDEGNPALPVAEYRKAAYRKKVHVFAG